MELATVTDEKGIFSVAVARSMPADSTFGSVLSTVAPEDNVIACDDLGDEWADFIGLRTDRASPRVTLYHAKHGDLKLGKSAFHVSVSQAITNLGNLALPASVMPNKLALWSRFYANGGVTKGINRTCRGTVADSVTPVEFCRNAPHIFQRVAIVTSSLSKVAVEQAFRDIQAGSAANPYFVQLYWRLSSFFVACTEVVAFGCVICQEGGNWAPSAPAAFTPPALSDSCATVSIS